MGKVDDCYESYFSHSCAAARKESLETEKPVVLIEDKIIRKFERLRKTMPVGNINRNIPILDPYVINNVSIDYDMSNFRLNGLLEDVKISGLRYFYVDKLELHVLPVQADLDMTFPALEISGKYNLKGKISRLIPIFGKGKFSIKVHRILLEIFLKLSLREEFVKVLDFGLEPFVEGFQIKITGILGSHVVSKVFSDIATALFPRIFQTLKNYVVQRISKIGLEFSKLLIGDDLTVKEIVYLIENDNDGLLPYPLYFG
ncbi:uncharacterized protein LOC143921692 [Arctopsyche grandis]|uniref:uncharacterized protein LOC143921692 n=1 Tax=Arctopsyche grandis TaxID=121162 RepID=UPI00406D9EF0